MSMDYFEVSIIEEPSIAFLEVDGGGVERFTDANGVTVECNASGAHYNFKNWITSRQAWMEPLVNPNPVDKIISPLTFLQSFTQTERIAIRTAAKDNIMLEDFMDLLNKATEVNLSHPDTIAGVNAFEAAGLIAPGRALEILGG